MEDVGVKKLTKNLLDFEAEHEIEPESDDIFVKSIEFYQKMANVKELSEFDHNNLVAHYLQAIHGKYDESKISPIGFFNFVGKERRSLWQQIQTLSSSDAQKNFCQLLKKHFLEYDSFITSFVVKPEEIYQSINISLPSLRYSNQLEEFKKLCTGSPIIVEAGDMYVVQYLSKNNSLKFHMSIIEGTVYWSIVTDHYDIGFRVFFDVNFEDSQEKSKKLSVEIIKSQRCNTHQLVHLGQHHYSSNGAYNFILDNSYSYLRAKTVYLNVSFSSFF